MSSSGDDSVGGVIENAAVPNFSTLRDEITTIRDRISQSTLNLNVHLKKAAAMTASTAVFPLSFFGRFAVPSQ